jgi:HK97 family phage major capsid protein
MPDLTLLNEELAQNVGRRQAIREQNKGAVLPEEMRSEFEQLTGRSEALISLIEVEKQKRSDAMLDEQRAYLDEPIHHVQHAMNADDDGRRSLLKTGWQAKAGMWYAPTSLKERDGSPRMQAMYNEDVLFGAIPTDDPDAAHYFKQTRAIAQPGYRAAWVKWLRNAGDKTVLSGVERNALSEGSDGAGGFVVPADIQADVMARRSQDSVMRSLATVRTTSRDRWATPAIKANSTDTASRNIYSDGFVGAWVGETPSQNDIDPAFELFEISIKKARAKTTLSNDLIADSVGNLLATLSASGARNLALVEDKGFIAGAGTALEPLGILSHSLALTAVASDGMAVDVEGSVSNTISNSISNAGSGPLIKGLVYKLPSQYTGNASWLMRRATQGEIAALVDANARPLWNSYLESAFTRPQMQIEGFPVYNSEFVGADGSREHHAGDHPADLRRHLGLSHHRPRPDQRPRADRALRRHRPDRPDPVVPRRRRPVELRRDSHRRHR